MEWLESIQKSIKYMEGHLLEEFSLKAMADEVFVSPFYLQKGFKMMTGYSPSEYIKYRRLYLAALDVISSDIKVIDLAYRYGYETPESFTKAFTRFHGMSPMQAKKNVRNIKVFLPLKIRISIQGGNEMDFIVEKMDAFEVIGFEREFSYETSYQEIPKFWDEICSKYFGFRMEGREPQTEVEKAIAENCIGEFGVCIDDNGNDKTFRYMAAGTYKGGDIPEGLTLYKVQASDWAKFKCVGPMPGALQSVNTQIFQEWLPSNPEYEMSMGINFEWYDMGDGSAPDYESAIWVPVKEK